MHVCVWASVYECFNAYMYVFRIAMKNQPYLPYDDHNDLEEIEICRS